MMGICINCNKEFSKVYTINGQKKTLKNRKKCFDCVPYSKNKFNGYVPIDTTEIKKCSYCKVAKYKSDFSPRHDTREPRSWCKDCVKNAVKNRALINQQKIINYKGIVCEKCGYNKSSKAIDYHHKEGTDKFDVISKMKTYSWNRIKQELDKCIVLCANCHRELHGNTPS